MKKPVHINKTRGPLKPASEMKKHEILSFLSHRYGYKENTLRVYIYKGEIFSAGDIREIYSNLERSDEEYEKYVSNLSETRGRKPVSKQKPLLSTVSFDLSKSTSIQLPAPTSHITVEGGTITSSIQGDGRLSLSDSVFAKLKQDIDLKIQRLEQKKRSIEEVERMYEEIESPL